MEQTKKSSRRVFWIVISMLIFMGIELLLGGVVFDLIRGRFVGRVFFIKLEMLLMLSGYFLGALLVGLLSPSVRVLEPAIGAALSVFFTFAYSFFTPSRFYGFWGNRVLFGAILAFLIAMLGADLGERLAAKLGNRHSKHYLDRTK